VTDHLLRVTGLRTHFPTKDGIVRAVDGVDLHVDPGETLGIVGESGSGKSMTVLSLMRLLPRPGRIVAGEVLYKGRDLVKASEQEMQEVRGAEIAMIFQDPMTSLNPVYRTGWQVGEPLRLHRGMDLGRSLREAVAMFTKVGIPEPDSRVRGSARVLGRHAAARDDRDGPDHGALRADRGRADDGAGRDHPGADPRAAQAGQPRVRHRHHPHHAQSRGWWQACASA